MRMPGLDHLESLQRAGCNLTKIVSCWQVTRALATHAPVFCDGGYLVAEGSVTVLDGKAEKREPSTGPQWDALVDHAVPSLRWRRDW